MLPTTTRLFLLATALIGAIGLPSVVHAIDPREEVRNLMGYPSAERPHLPDLFSNDPALRRPARDLTLRHARRHAHPLGAATVYGTGALAALAALKHLQIVPKEVSNTKRYAATSLLAGALAGTYGYMRADGQNRRANHYGGNQVPTPDECLQLYLDGVVDACDLSHLKSMYHD